MLQMTDAEATRAPGLLDGSLGSHASTVLDASGGR
jgi:hypothetical protein